MGEQRVTIKVGLTGAAATRREANSTGKAVKGIGTAAEHTAKKTRLAEHAMHGLEKSSHKLRHTVRELAGVTGLAGLAFGTEEMVKSAITAEAAQAKLTATLKTSGISYRKHGKEIDEALDKQAQFAGFTKGAVSDSLGNFIRTTGNVGKALKLNNIAFDLAHTKGLGLAQAQSLLARVYNGSYTGLKRLGIAITPITVEQDKLRLSGKKATYQQIQRAKADDKAATATQALAIVQRKFSGQTAAYGKTAAGSVDRARISLEIAQEQIGKVLLPYVAKAAQKVAGLAQAFVKEWPKISATIKTDAAKVKKALDPLLSYVDRHQKGVRNLALGFAGIALGLKAIKKVGHFTGLSKAASGLAHPVAKILGIAKADGSIKRPFYVVVLNGKGGFAEQAKKYGGLAALAGGAAASLSFAALVAVMEGRNLAARKAGITDTTIRSGPFVAGDPNRQAEANVATGTWLLRKLGINIGGHGSGSDPVDPRAVPNNIATRAILQGGLPPIVIQNDNHTLATFVLDGKVLATAVAHAANKKKALK